MTAETPNSRWPHLFVVARYDDHPDPADAVTLVSAYRQEAAAEAEAARLDALNGDRSCRYAVLVTRLKGEAAR